MFDFQKFQRLHYSSSLQMLSRHLRSPVEITIVSVSADGKKNCLKNEEIIQNKMASVWWSRKKVHFLKISEALWTWILIDVV